MKKHFNIEETILEYLQGELHGRELEEFMAWKDASHENSALVKKYESVYAMQDRYERMVRIDRESALDKVHARINKHRINWFTLVSRVAAVLFIPLLATSIWLALDKYGKGEVDEQLTYNEVSTTYGTRSLINLPDGTKVWLNSGSLIKYPVQFKRDKRNVTLSGEAFFDVEHNENKPFYVSSGDLSVKVLGTSFNFSAYEDDDFISTTLVEGHVKLVKTGQSGKEIELCDMTPSERAFFEKDQNNITIRKVEVDQYTAWKDGELVFRNEAMDVVVKKLERWFNVDILLKDEQLKEYNYTASFEDETLLQVLDMLKFSAPIDYTFTKRRRLPDNTFSKRKVEIRLK